MRAPSVQCRVEVQPKECVGEGWVVAVYVYLCVCVRVSVCIRRAPPGVGIAAGRKYSAGKVLRCPLCVARGSCVPWSALPRPPQPCNTSHLPVLVAAAVFV